MIAFVIGIVVGFIVFLLVIILWWLDAKDMFGKLVFYMGWVGMCLFGWGIWELIFVVMNIGVFISVLIYFIFWVAMVVIDFLFGFFFGFGFISKYVFGKSEVVF